MAGGRATRPIKRFVRPYFYAIDDITRKIIVGTRDRLSYDFYTRLVDSSFEPNRQIDVLPKQRLLYVCVPKCASSRIKMTFAGALSEIGS